MNRKHIVAFCLAVGCFMLVQPGLRAGQSNAVNRLQTPAGQTTSPRQSTTPALSGLRACGNTVLQDGTPVRDVHLRLRNVDTGAIMGQTRSDRNGAFAFTVAAPGTFVAEAINNDGSVLAVGPSLNIVADPVCGNVILPAGSTKAAGAGFFHSAAFPILAAAGGAGIAAWAISSSQAASPEQ